MADLSKRLMSQNEITLQEFGLGLIERMPMIPELDQEVLVHLLVNFENSALPFKERATKKLDQLATTKLVDAAKNEIQKRQLQR